MSSPHFHALRVSSIGVEGEDAKVLSFEVPAGLADRYRFDAGQYLTLKHGGLRRSYSICAAPGEPLRVGVRRVAGGAFSPWLHEQLKVGDSLDVMEPQGRFGHAVQLRPQHVLAVAGYNAGPGNVRKFIRANGDPRNGTIDWIDWIEKIPLPETRNYVQRVIENAVVYEAMNPARASYKGANTLSHFLGKNTPG